MRALLVMFMLALAGQTCEAAEVLTGARIIRVYAQSHADSTAHLIMIDRPLSGCDANRLYIDVADKELFASALANYLAERSVDLVFDRNGAPKTAAGHIAGFTCRVVSIF